MIDAIISMTSAVHPQFIAISKHGKLPEVHIDNLLPYPSFIDPNNLPTTALEITRKVRSEIKRAALSGFDWRSCLDSLRPYTIMMWQNLNLREKKKILNLISSTWNTHRHRRPKPYKEILTHLRIIPGSIDSIEINENQPIKIKVKTRGSPNSQIIEADYLVNCSGPEMNVLKNKSFFFTKTSKG